MTRATGAGVERVSSGRSRILKVEPREFAERWDVGCERER